MRQFKYIAVILTMLWSAAAMGQGCSDPGICTTGDLNSTLTRDTVSPIDFTNASLEELLGAEMNGGRYRFGIATVYNRGEYDVKIYNTIFRASMRLKENIWFTVKLPYSVTNGMLGSASGTGDLNWSFQNTFKSGKHWNIAYTIGGVVPTNNANANDNGTPLPMAYQTSLGATNVLGGLSADYKTWSAAVGYQHSIGKNGNEFTNEALVTDPTLVGFDPLNAERQRYTTSRHIERGSDIIFRLEKRFVFKRFSVVAGVLPIYRLSNSTVETLTAGEQEVVGSNGLTLNITGGIKYRLSENTNIRFNVGGPTIMREYRPDGLTRAGVYILALTHRVW